MQRTIIFIADFFPNPIATVLEQHGYNVLHAASVDEAAQLSEGTEVDAIVVAPDQDWLELEVMKRRQITLNLTVHATGPEVFFELSHLFADGSVIQ